MSKYWTSWFKGRKLEVQEVLILSQVQTPKLQLLMCIMGRQTAEVVPVSDVLISKVPFIIYAMYSNWTALHGYNTAMHGYARLCTGMCTVGHGNAR